MKYAILIVPAPKAIQYVMTLDIGIDAEEETIVRTVKPAIPQPGSVVLHTEEVTEDDDGEHMIDNHDETMILVNSGASCSSQKQ